MCWARPWAALCVWLSVAAVAAGQDVFGCMDPAADNFNDPLLPEYDPTVTENDPKLCRYAGWPRVPLAGEGSRLGYQATEVHCREHGGHLVSSDTLKVLGHEAAMSLQPREWPVYEALDRVEGMPPVYVCVGGGWGYSDTGLDGQDL
jgi:hypothetical protein